MAHDDHSDSTRPEVQPVPPQYWWLKRILAAVGVLVVLLITMRLYWGYEADRRLQVEIARYRAAGEPVYPKDFDPPPVPDAENAALLLQQAADAMVEPTDVPFALHKLLSYPRLYANRLDEIGEVVKANQQALRLLRQARSLHRADWGTRLRSPVMDASRSRLPELSAQRHLARLSCIAAMYHNHTGDDAAAVESLRDVLGCVNAMGEIRGLLVTHLVVLAGSGLVASTVQEIAPRLRVGADGDATDGSKAAANRRQVLDLMADLLDEEAVQRSWRRAWYSERLWHMEALGTLNGRTVSPNAVLAYSGAFVSPGWNRVLAYTCGPGFKLRVVEEMQLASGYARAGYEKSYSAALDFLPEESTLDRVWQRGVKALAPLYVRGPRELPLLVHWKMLAERRMAAVALAIRLYEVDHGYRPEALADLVPNYLSAMPSDPFAGDGRCLGYLADAPEPALYSVGDDGEDDGGDFSRPSGVMRLTKDIPFYLDGKPGDLGQEATAPGPAER